MNETLIRGTAPLREIASQNTEAQRFLARCKWEPLDLETQRGPVNWDSLLEGRLHDLGELPEDRVIEPITPTPVPEKGLIVLLKYAEIDGDHKAAYTIMHVTTRLVGKGNPAMELIVKEGPFSSGYIRADALMDHIAAVGGDPTNEYELYRVHKEDEANSK